ncbi:MULTISPECIES: hypothetical protein [unclassified Variovorax]|uniref:hypothetical protein n=1 Tax=unclassified Variovorax TaxID=663243 RepID=UPI00076CF1FB|nr:MULTISPECIES: hypothetical protein [unclassified Variovorax]KWT97098.1 hypothetical protein APY03_1783 [Variovorax sp. WDL1]PNG55667.1 hypothetical protein CHC07_02077 [Variovorax sp. B4]PNG57091.1 hypothetical protein CHC06_02080 [Variovorax sp. B2]VTV10606.1 hypothetical protein WDL1CHR_01551 [Variovorax sp. WDL1]
MTPVDPLFYVLLAALALVFGYAARRGARRLPERPVQEQAAEELQEAVEARESPPNAAVDGREPRGRSREPSPIAQRPVRRTSAALTDIAPPRRTRTQAMLGSRQGLRDAVVSMTVLGRCRALQPHSTPGADAAGSGAERR